MSLLDWLSLSMEQVEFLVFNLGSRKVGWPTERESGNEGNGMTNKAKQVDTDRHRETDRGHRNCGKVMRRRGGLVREVWRRATACKRQPDTVIHNSKGLP